MSTELHNSEQGSNGAPVHSDVAFEKRDVSHVSVLAFLFYLALTLIASFGICWGVLLFTESRIALFDPPPPPIRRGAAAAMPPEPRLQAQGIPGHDRDPQQDLRVKLKLDRETLEKAAWVDEKAGVAQIPIEDAMKILAEKGLPEVAPPTPPAKR
jgi:hypothetical protein